MHVDVHIKNIAFVLCDFCKKNKILLFIAKTKLKIG